MWTESSSVNSANLVNIAAKILEIYNFFLGVTFLTHPVHFHIQSVGGSVSHWLVDVPQCMCMVEYCHTMAPGLSCNVYISRILVGS